MQLTLELYTPHDDTGDELALATIHPVHGTPVPLVFRRSQIREVIFYGGQLFEVPTFQRFDESGQPVYSRLLWYVADAERLIHWAKHHEFFRYQPQGTP